MKKILLTITLLMVLCVFTSCYNFESENKNLSVINKDKTISLDEIYIPKEFDKKYSM